MTQSALARREGRDRRKVIRLKRVPEPHKKSDAQGWKERMNHDGQDG